MAATKTAKKRAGGKRRWSARVMQRSDALDLKNGVFKLKDPRAIARSLSRSAQASRRRKSEPYRSAMSMLTFYINRAGERLGGAQRRRLEKAKDALRELYGRPPRRASGASTRRRGAR